MSIIELIDMVTNIVTIFALGIGSFVAVFIYFQFAPLLLLRITPKWIDATKQYVIIQFQIENLSRVRVLHPTGRIQVLEHALNEQDLSHWVPFDKGEF